MRALFALAYGAVSTLGWWLMSLVVSSAMPFYQAVPLAAVFIAGTFGYWIGRQDEMKGLGVQ